MQQFAAKLAAARKNAEEIDLDVASAAPMPTGMKDFEDKYHIKVPEGSGTQVEEQALPATLFGSLTAADAKPAPAASAASASAPAASSEVIGAKARFKRKADN